MQSSRTFRIFVSSTFSDLKGERNALQEKVFPRLRDLAAAHGCRFQAIDLRWGVSEEAALDQQTMKICLGEIERCQKVTPRPNFIILLGDRYGWRPLPYEIPAGEFEQIISLVTKEEKELLEQWYRRDDNTVPPVYLLQPRGSKFVEYETWEKIETRLRQVFLSVLQKISISPDAALKYAASATELEIVAGALKVQNAQEHVFGFFREIQGLPQDSEDFGNPDADAAQRQGELRGRLKEQLPGNIHEYTARWQGDGPSLDHIDQLCEDVYADLSRVILAEINQLESVDPLDKEISAHDDFRKDRARIFIGRTDILKAISDYIDSINPHPLVVWGVSGSGKSALMAKAVQQARDSGNEVLCRFIGATPESSNGRSLLESLCKQISHRYGADETTIPSEYNDLVQGFPERLVLAKSGKPLILFLDALDQLSDMNNARNLAWLADELPPNVHLIVSTLPGECLDRLERRLPEENRLELQPMPMVEGETLLDLWLAEAGRTLQPEQRADVLNKYQLCGLPLYLRLAFEEVRRWRSYDGLPAGADDQPGLGEEIPGILHDLFWRLSQESNHGQVLVERSLGYLAASKNGLSEDEIMDLLSMDTEVLKDFRVRLPKSPDIERLPVVVWSRLYVDLEPYLTERSADGTALMAFYHRQLGEVAAEEYLVESVKKERHCALAQYFQAQPFQGETEGKGIPNLRKLSELPYQQTQGRMWSELEALLTDLEFIETKCAAQKTYDLVADYTSAFNELPEMQEEKRRECERDNQIALYTQELICVREQKRLPLPKPPASVRVWTDEEIERDIERINKDPSHLDRIQAFAQFVNSEAHNFARYALQPMFCIQQAYNQADSGPVAQTAKHAIGTTIDAVIILRTPISLPPFNPHPACLRTLEGHLDVVEAVGISTNGHLAVSGGWENTLHVWDIALGQCLRILEGHSGIVWAVSLTPDGRLAVSGSADNTLRLWEVETGRCLQTLRGHSEGVSAVSVSPDGNLAISGGSDKTLRVWDLETGQCLRILEGHIKCIDTVSLTPDGRLAVSGDASKTLRIWDVKNGLCIRTLEGHSEVFDDVNKEVCLTTDGRVAISSSKDKTLRLWNIETGLCLAIVAHSAALTSIAVKRDQVVAGDEVGNLLFFEIHNLKWGPSIVTPVRLWKFGIAGRPGAWDSNITVFCEWCSKRFVVQPTVLDTIMDITTHTIPNQIPSVSLPQGAWDEPRLLSECPLCNQPLRYNPFIVDNRDRY